MPRPHGGKLVNRFIEKATPDIEELPTFEINTNLSEDILNLSYGVFSPLEGFLCNNDLENVIKEK